MTTFKVTGMDEGKIVLKLLKEEDDKEKCTIINVPDVANLDVCILRTSDGEKVWDCIYSSVAASKVEQLMITLISCSSYDEVRAMFYVG